MGQATAGPDFDRETRLMASGAARIAGVDEVGRGPLAGPVTAAAVRLDPGRIPEGLDDSKRLGRARREALHDALREVADVSVAHASVAEIETLNILGAAELAMRRAVAGLAALPDHVLVDGNRAPGGLSCACTCIVRGDAACLSIAAASIVAKVTRDRLMSDLAAEIPGYGWETNAGYPTEAHLAALLRLGPSPQHRRLFRPVHDVMCADASLTP